jgi:hypothetical protein
MLPKGVIVKTEKNILYWKNVTYNLSVDEAKMVAEEVLKLAQQPNIEVMLVDNRGSRGAWPADINSVWSELMVSLAKNILKSATVAEKIVVMQINRISKGAGTLEQVQAFEDMKDALAFLGVSQLSIE